MKSYSAWLPLTLAALSAIFLGCAPQHVKVPADYGARSGYQKTQSVNGTYVLGELFRRAGYSVRSVNRLSPRIQESDVIIWAPDSFDPPTPETIEYLEEWLSGSVGRTLVYIDRDFDAAIEYWTAMQDQATAEDLLVAQREQGIAQHDFNQKAADSRDHAACDWFEVRRDLPLRRPKALIGRWAPAIDPAKTNVVLRSRIEMPEDWGAAQGSDLAGYLTESEALLATADGNDLIAFRYYEPYDGGNQLIMINNGSFLLNQPLVNHEHRNLAAQLIEQCGYGQTVTFLETDDRGVDIVTANEVIAGRSGWEWLTVWPISPLGLHIALLLIVFCFASYPIFGRAKRLPETHSSDFQKHIGALGELLEATDDYDYAQERVRQYQQIARGETVYRRVGRARV
ncbi:MAG: DUF4350 domain-containing protein [Blastopirellula sp. JB062]